MAHDRCSADRAPFSALGGSGLCGVTPDRRHPCGPAVVADLHTVAALAGIGACCALLLSAPRAHPVAAGLAAAVLLALLVNAAITGGLSGPHDRYQSRIMWLPPLVA